MLIRDIRTADYFASRDGCTLCELLHPKDNPALQMDMSLCHCILGPGEATVPHCLECQTEVYYILSGMGEMHIGDKVAKISSGQAIPVPPEAMQWIANAGTEELVFLAICQPQWREEDEAIGGSLP